MMLGGGAFPYNRGTPVQGYLVFNLEKRTEFDPCVFLIKDIGQTGFSLRFLDLRKRRTDRILRFS